MGKGSLRNSSMSYRYSAALLSMVLVAGACGDDSDDAGGTGDTETEEGSGPGADVVYPGADWSHAEPEEMGFDPVLLDELAAEAEGSDSHCVVVTRDGQIVAEWYWGATEPDTQIEAFSATKSYTSSLVGLAVEETDLELDDKASDYIEEWVGSDSEDITVRNLISNDSGRSWMQTLGFEATYVSLAGSDDRTGLALDYGQDGPPGEVWEYNDGAIQTLDPILQSVVGTTPSEYAEEKIFDPIGAADTDMTTDEAGGTAMFFAIQTTCRDMARYGYLFLRDGVWEGEQVLPEGWVQEATGQPSQDLSANYGYLWWLNRPGGSVDVGGGGGGADDLAAEAQQDVPGAPDDMYWARGLGGQIIQVDPGSDTVVTRMGPGEINADYGSAETARFVTDALVD